MAPEITRRLIDRYVAGVSPLRPIPPGLAQLTARERDVLALMARGMSNAEIGHQLFVSEGTVKTHVVRILAKLRLRDRVQAVVFAYENGVVEPGYAGRPD